MLIGLLTWWISIYWSFSSALPRSFDDWKGGIFYVGCGLFFAFCIKRNPSHQDTIALPSILYIFYLLGSALSLINSSPFYEGWLAWARLFLLGGFIWSLSLLEWSHLKRIAQFGTLSAALIALFSLLALHQIFSLWPKMDPSLLAPIGHITYYGDFMALHLPIAAFLFFTSKKSTQKILWGTTIPLIFSGLWITATRASIMGLLGAVLLVLLIGLYVRRPFFNKKILTLSVVPVLIIIAVISFQTGNFRGEPTWDRIQGMFDVVSDPKDLAKISPDRWKGYNITMKIIGERPFIGWGLGSFRFIYPEFAKGASSNVSTWYMHPHNEILHQWMEVGFLGLIPFLAIFGVLYKKVFDFFNRRTGTEDQNVAMVLMAVAGLTISIISWQFSTNFLFPVSRLVTAFYLSILLKVSKPMHCGPIFYQVPWKKITFIIAVLSTFLLAGYHVGLYSVQKSLISESEDEAIKWSNRGYFFAPRAFDPLFHYSVTHLAVGNLGRAVSAIQTLYDNFPYVPSVLYYQAQAKLLKGENEDAQLLLMHAIKNDPSFEAAKSLLSNMTAPDIQQ